MRRNINKLLQKINIAHYFNGKRTKPHNLDLLLKVLHRTTWRVLVLYACDNMNEFFPLGKVVEWNCRDQKSVRMPKKWRVPKSVLEGNVHKKVYHLVQIKPHVLKVVRLKEPRKPKGYTIYIDGNNQHLRFGDYGWYEPSNKWYDMDCGCHCALQTCRFTDVCILSLMKEHGLDTLHGNSVKKVLFRALDDFKYDDDSKRNKRLYL